MMVEDGKLSDAAKRLVAGWLDCAKALCAFGNTIPISYLRLVPHQEAPTSICWGDRNRSVLVRVPLGWHGAEDMIKDANPGVVDRLPSQEEKQTVEFRSPDGSADLYSLMAGLVVAAQHGLQMEDALERAGELYVDVNIFREEHREEMERLERLPASCWEAAEALSAKRDLFERDGVFPRGMIDSVIKKLKSYEDRDLSERVYGKEEIIREMVEKYLHCM